MKEFIAIIPARKNSKRIKNKNTKKIKNKILFNYTLDEAKKVSKISNIVITTDIRTLLKKNTKRIIYIKRPKNLCLDTSSTESAIFHALKYIKKKKNIVPENIILLQPTSPFRTNIDIEKSIKLFKKKKYDSLLSAYVDKLFIWKKKGNSFDAVNYNINKRQRAQNLKKFIIENGAIFIFNYKKFLRHKVRLFGKKGCYLMSKKKSLDVDDNYDLFLARKY